MRWRWSPHLRIQAKTRLWESQPALPIWAGLNRYYSAEIPVDWVSVRWTQSENPESTELTGIRAIVAAIQLMLNTRELKRRILELPCNINVAIAIFMLRP